MMPAILVILVVFALVLFIQFGALVEMFQQLRQVRAYLEMVDKPTPLDLGVSAGLAPSAVGLPAGLDRADFATVLFLSDKCGTCVTLAESLRNNGLPEIMWVVVEPTSGNVAPFLDEFDLHSERVTVDYHEHIAGRLGLTITPVAITVEHGRLMRAQTIPSVRQMYAAMPTAASVQTLKPVGLVGKPIRNGEYIKK